MDANTIFLVVINAMQAAEELGAPEGADYISLMDRIADEARSRAENARTMLEQ